MINTEVTCCIWKLETQDKRWGEIEKSEKLAVTRNQTETSFRCRSWTTTTGQPIALTVLYMYYTVGTESFSCTPGTYWVAARCVTEVPPVQYIYTGNNECWWLYGGHWSVVKHWWFKPGVRFLVTVSFSLFSIFDSLVPRPSHCPVFDRLQYAKTERKTPGPFYHVNDVGVYSTSRKTLNKRLTSGRVLRLCPPTHWTQFALRSSACVCMRLCTSVCVCEPSTVKSNFQQYLS